MRLLGTAIFLAFNVAAMLFLLRGDPQQAGSPVVTPSGGDNTPLPSEIAGPPATKKETSPPAFSARISAAPS